MKLRTPIIASLVAATPSLALADAKMEIGAFVGLHLWSDNNELGIQDPGPEEIQNSPVFGFRVGRAVHDYLSLEGELALAPGTTDESGTDLVAFGYRLQLRVHPARGASPFRPFALIGVGGSTAASSDLDIAENDTDFVSHGGVGFEYRVARDWGFRFDARLLLPPARDGLVTTDGEFLVGFYKTFPAKPVAKPAPVETAPPPVPVEPLPAPVAPPPAVQPPPPPPPPPPPAAVKKFEGALRGVDFATNSDRLTPSSSTVLDEAVKVLAEYPAVRIEISGHTDATGDADYNRELSRRRAESVKAYFVGKGIAADRLTAVGHGPDKPVADNTTPEGRARNRRVEIAIQ